MGSRSERVKKRGLGGVPALMGDTLAETKIRIWLKEEQLPWWKYEALVDVVE